uniref:Si:ch1073-70f20.1 n=1 Tax=Cyprinus carpio carpio TaxID=630221 RepID=A0A9J8D216_CYPCA
MTEWGSGEDGMRECRYIKLLYDRASGRTREHISRLRTPDEDRGRKQETREKGRILKDMQTNEMKVLQAVFCVVSVLQLCHHGVSSSGECYFNAKASCEHNGRVFDIGEAWVNDECFQCVCLEPFGVGCCEHGKQPVDFPPWCEAIRKPDSCTVAVVMKANHKLPCLFGGKARLWKSENDPLF